MGTEADVGEKKSKNPSFQKNLDSAFLGVCSLVTNCWITEYPFLGSGDHMKSDTASLAQLFEKDHFYEIPSFQRPFSWDEENFRDLVDDLISTDPKSQYFLGSIVYFIEDATRMVVDGQQRITSLLILLACIRDAVEDDKIKNDLQGLIIQPEDTVRQIERRDRLHVKDHEIFHAMVSEFGGTNKEFDYRDFDEPGSRYIIARNVFREKLSKLQQNNLIELMIFVSNRCLLIYLEASTFEEAFRLFEVVNDRGKQLRRIDLLKSYNLDPKFVPSKSKRNLLSSQWEQDESSIGESDFESLFNMMRLIMTRSKPVEDLYSEFKNRIFKENKIEVGERFFIEVSAFVDIYKKIFKDYSYLDGHELAKHFRALISIMDDGLRTFEWRACVLAFSAKFGRDKIYDFCLKVEKVVLGHAVNGVRKDERYADFINLLSLIDKSKTDEECVNIIKTDDEKIKSKIIEDDLYKKPYEKYLLLRLELAVAELDQIREFTARTTEHVFPQNPDEGSDWAKLASDEERKKFVDKIGNLVLLSRGMNSAASNLDFNEKKKKYLEKRVSDYPRSSQILGYEDWNEEIIKKRTNEAAELILKDPAR